MIITYSMVSQDYAVGGLEVGGIDFKYEIGIDVDQDDKIDMLVNVESDDGITKMDLSERWSTGKSIYNAESEDVFAENFNEAEKRVIFRIKSLLSSYPARSSDISG